MVTFTDGVSDWDEFKFYFVCSKLSFLGVTEHLLENPEHLSAIRALAAVCLDTWKTFAQTTGAKSFSGRDEMSFSPKLCGICSLLKTPHHPTKRHFASESFTGTVGHV